MATVPDDLPENPKPAPAERLTSIDALRGFDMFWIVGGDSVARALCKWWGTPEALRLRDQFEHVEWEGFRFYDLIFPLFLFLVGVVLPFSLRKYHDGRPSQEPCLAAHGAAGRAAIPAGDDLQRPAEFPLRQPADGRGLAADRRLLRGRRADLPVHEGPDAGDRVPGDPGGLLGGPDVRARRPRRRSPATSTSETNLAGYFDRHYLPGERRCCYGYGDNEGLLSTIPAVATALLGVLAGNWLLTDRAAGSRPLGLAATGGACLGLGLLWGRDFPIIKNLWTSSFVLVAGGWSLLLLSLFYTVIDVLGSGPGRSSSS